MSQVKVAPSLLAADPLNFEQEARAVEQAGADFHHVDVMDGHFVPNLTFGLPFVAALKKISKIPLDVHIMVTNPDEVALQYIDAGADLLTFHVEAATHHHRIIQAVHAKGAKCGLAINPGTAIETLWPLLESVDIINIMSVNPGFGGQSFIDGALARIQMVHERLETLGRRRHVLLEVDGGVNGDTGPQVVGAGADLLVAGSFVYGADDRKKAISALKALG